MRRIDSVSERWLLLIESAGIVVLFIGVSLIFAAPTAWVVLVAGIAGVVAGGRTVADTKPDATGDPE